MVPRRIVGCAAVMAATLAMPLAAAPPDAKLREQIKASIDLGVNWLRWQLDGEGTWRGDAFTTARAVSVFAESHRKYIEDDGPFMRRPVGFLRQAVAHRRSPVVSAATVLALAPLKVAADQALIRAEGEVVRKWLAESAAAVRPIDLEQVTLAVAAARAAGIPGGTLVNDVNVLLIHGTTDSPIPGFREALRADALLRAGASTDHEVLRDSLAEIGKSWGWWAVAERVAKSGYPVPPVRYWQALARAMDAAGKPTVVDAAGQIHDWKIELSKEVMKSQQFEGYWLEGEEKISSTIAAVAALELVYRQ